MIACSDPHPPNLGGRKKRVRADDLVKTPVSHDMGALRRCNPPAS